MAFRSLASLSLSFGLVSIPVKVYSATEASAAVRFKLLSRGGQRVRREYVATDDVPVLAEEDGDSGAPAAAPPVPAEAAHAGRPSARAAVRASEPDVAAPARGSSLGADEIVKGYEFEKGRFVTFTSAELKALAESSRPTIDIVSFIPSGSVDPLYFDKAYYLAPDARGSKTFSLLHAAMRSSGRAALAKWAWRAKEYVVEIRPAGNGFVLQQLRYADEVRSIDDLGIELAPVGDTELALALRLIEQIADERYDPQRFVDEEKQRILAAVEKKIAGRKVVAEPPARAPSAEVIDLVAALRASLQAPAPPARSARTARRRQSQR